MICIYPANATDFSTLGICVLDPTEAKIEGEQNGMMELTLTHPMDADGKWTYLTNYSILRAPCPVRETPLIRIMDEPTTVTKTTTRTICQVHTSSGKRLRLRAKPNMSAKVLGYYKNGTRVIRMGTSGSWTRVVIARGGATGWMDTGNLQTVTTQTETVTAIGTDTPSKSIEPRQTREQIFRICEVKRDDAARLVYVTAKHIFYDLAANTVKSGYSPEGQPVASVCEQLLARALNDHDFSIYCNAEGNITGDYSRMNIANAILEDEIGVAAQSGARIVLDNFDIFVLKDETRDNGVEIRHAKNMKGAELTENAESVITRIIPVGKDKDGNPLPLPNDEYVESPRAANIPIVRSREIEYDVSVGKGDGQYKTNELAYAKLRELAAADFTENGLDAPTVGLDVDFVALENTSRYKDYAPLQAVQMGDTVRVVSPVSGIDAKLRMTGFTYNVLYGRYDAVRMGDLTDLKTQIYGFDIAASSLPGTRLLPGSVDGQAVLRSASIGYAKIAQAAIDQLSTDAVTAIRANIHKIVSGEITTDQLYADLADLTVATIKTAKIDWAEIENLNADIIKAVTARLEKVVAEEITTDKLTASIVKAVSAHLDRVVAGNITTDELYAAIAEVTSLYVSTGKFTLAEIQNLLANALILKQGIADSMMITNLAVTSANLLNATIDKLVLKGADGKYYRVFVGADGTIQTEEVTVTDGEVAAGETEEGRQIVATTANVGSLNATTIKASQAVINTIFTESLTAGKITANEALIASATIPILYTTAITALGNSLDLSANESIKLTVQGVRDDVDAAADAAETALGLAEVAQDTANSAQTAAEAAQETADAATETAAEIQTQLEVTKNGLSVIQTETIPGLDGRVKTLESGVHIEGAKIGIYTSESPYRNTITNSGWVISENGTPIIECAETKLTAPRVQITDAMIIGGLAWKPGTDKHVRLLKYGR